MLQEQLTSVLQGSGPQIRTLLAGGPPTLKPWEFPPGKLVKVFGLNLCLHGAQWLTSNVSEPILCVCIYTSQPEHAENLEGFSKVPPRTEFP